MLDIMIFSNKMILEGEIKDAKMTSFSSDFQTLIKNLFLLYFLYELLMSLRIEFSNKMNVNKNLPAREGTDD